MSAPPHSDFYPTRTLIRQATFSDPGACLENVEYLPDRGLKQEELLRFGTCNYIQVHHNISLLGATGSGKTYLACALGMAAARRFYIQLERWDCSIRAVPLLKLS